MNIDDIVEVKNYSGDLVYGKFKGLSTDGRGIPVVIIERVSLERQRVGEERFYVKGHITIIDTKPITEKELGITRKFANEFLFNKLTLRQLKELKIKLECFTEGDFEEVCMLMQRVINAITVRESEYPIVYIVDQDNGEQYSDNSHWTEKVFKHEKDAADFVERGNIKLGYDAYMYYLMPVE